MKKYLLAALVLQAFNANANYEPIETQLTINELERGFQPGDDAEALSISFLASKGVNSIGVESEAGHNDGKIQDHEAKLYYGREVANDTTWVLGWRGDMETDEERHWLMTGLEFLLPYETETRVLLFLGEHKRSGMRLESAREFALAERVSLVPEVKLNAHGTNDEAAGHGSGFSTAEFAVRAFYAVNDNLSFYTGAVWEKAYGNTADFLREEGEDTEASRYLLGLSYEF